MGDLEKKVAARGRREKIQQKIALTIFRLTTRSGRLAFAPEAVLRRRLFPEEEKGNATSRMRQAVRRLASRKLVRWERGDRGWSVCLTARGQAYAERLHTAELIKIRKPSAWDKKWRIVIFDVWERRRNVRDKLRRALQHAGFRRLQDSVWVSPYDCEDLIAFLRTDLRLGKSLRYLIADIENDAELLHLFKLG